MISSALYLGTTSLQVSASTGGVNANVYSGVTLVRQGFVPAYAESVSAPALAAEGDKWWSTSNSTPFRYLSGGWRKLVAAPPVLYAFTTATFNTGGQTGYTGPVISQARSGLTGTPTPSGWSSTYLNMTTQGIMLWTVPVTGSYTITCAGSRGGSSSFGSGGLGAVMTNVVNLSQSDILQIAIGQVGLGNSDGAGGGGGTFVIRNGSALLIAGGGGGAGGYQQSTTTQNGVNASLSTSGTNSYPGSGQYYLSDGIGGTNGNGGTGGQSHRPGGGGGGYIGNGSAYTDRYGGGGFGYGGNSFLNGGVGGLGENSNATEVGGFGGGAGGALGGGGGGGYSGGGGGTWGGYTASDWGKGGGGGGSYTSVTLQSTSTNSGAGYVTITKI